MGWLNPDEQRATKKKYRVHAYYVCDHCKLPILDAPLVDPKGGYHQWPKTLKKECRCFLSREPKRTYHVKPCGLELFSKSGRKRKFNEDVTKLADRMLQRIKRKKNTKEQLLSHYQKLFDKKLVKKALSLLRKEKKIRKRKGVYVSI